MKRETAYVLNLDRRPDRWAECQRHWSPWFELVRFPAIEMSDGARGCKLSHLACAQKYLPENASILVLEDDSVPTEAFSRIGLECITEANKHLFEWDWINGSPLLDLSVLRLPQATLDATDSPLFFKSSYCHNTNWNIYNHDTLPLLEASLSSHLPVDMFLAQNCQSVWVSRELIAIQSESPSDIRYPFPKLENLYDLSRKILKEMRGE